jgi:ABC-type nitrate/sulfonate/bicarbonate transport system permease component
MRPFRTIVKGKLPYLSMIILLSSWETAIRLGGLNLTIFPPPTLIVSKLIGLLTPIDGELPVLIKHLLVSLSRLVVAATLSAIFGVCVGMLAGMNRYVYRIILPIINALYPLPPYAWVPFLLLWLGRGNATIVLVTWLSASLPLIYNTMAGVRGVDHRQVWALKTFGAKRLAVVRYVVLPSTFASIILGIRLSLGQAWRTLVGAEFLAAPEAGIGFLIFNARQFLAIDVMFAGIFVLGIFGYLVIYWMVGVVENSTIVRWGIIARR